MKKFYLCRNRKRFVMEINVNTSIGDIVKANFKTAQLFTKNSIDFCCGGGISLKEACKKSNVDIGQLVPELQAIVQQIDPDARYMDEMPLNELCDYIEKRHHRYVNENTPFLQAQLQKLCNVHGQNHPELFEIKDLFDIAASNLSTHMKKEELILFPSIQNMIKVKNENGKSINDVGEVERNINVLDEEHQTEGDRFVKISALTSAYTCPPDGCSTYQVTYQMLKDFEADLHRHIHLENNILFKKALILERNSSLSFGE